MTDPIKPRTIPQIVADLLEVAIDSQWSDRTNDRYQDYPEPCCPDCSAHQHTKAPDNQGWPLSPAPNEHLAKCPRMALIKEVTAFLEVENQLAKERGEEQVRIPS